jgi:hypothetical protein
MSQYINQMNCNIAEIVRLQFNEVIQDDQPPIFSTIICMHYEFLKAVYDTIGKTIEQHEEQLKNVKSNQKLS